MRAAAGATLGVAGLLVLSPAAAHAASPMHRSAASAELPPVGEDDMVTLSDDLSFTLNGQECHAHLAGSVDEDVVAQDAADQTDVVAERGLRLSGPDTCDSGANQTRQGGGTITVAQNDADVDAKSLLKLTQQFPPRFEQVMVLSFTMTIDQPDAANNQTRAAGEPLVLTTKNPGVLVGQLTQFPPRGDLYQLQNPIDLVLPDDPDTTIAMIQKFPVKVGGL